MLLNSQQAVFVKNMAVAIGSHDCDLIGYDQATFLLDDCSKEITCQSNGIIRIIDVEFAEEEVYSTLLKFRDVYGILY